VARSAFPSRIAAPRAAGFRPQLFDRFTPADNAKRGGAGLGLAIARGYADAVGAELKYEPAEPRGAASCSCYRIPALLSRAAFAETL